MKYVENRLFFNKNSVSYLFQAANLEKKDSSALLQAF